MSKEQVEELLGVAIDVSIIEGLRGERVEVWHYNEPQVSLFFECDEGLSNIDIADRGCILFEKPIFKLDRAGVLALLKENGYVDIEVEEEAWGEVHIAIPSDGFDFFFDGETLISINISA